MMSLKKIEVEQNEFDEFNDHRFDLKDITNQAINILNDYTNRKIMLEGTFESDVWRFVTTTNYVKVYFNFNELRKKLTFLSVDVERIISSLKCWVAILIPSSSLESLRKYYKYVEEFLVISQVFDEQVHEKTSLFLQHECDDRKRWNLCVPTLNFLDFYEEIDTAQIYRKLLVDIKKDINVEKVGGMARKLPPSQDVLVFSWAVEDFFKKHQISDANCLRYYPIYLWWTLSNLIPMRPSEFCSISNEALSQENERYYITLPRLKQKDNYHRIQIIDKIAIPKDLHEKLKEYLTITKKFGPTKTLIHPLSIRLRTGQEQSRFVLLNLQTLLHDFYLHIIEGAYKMEYTQKIRPGDARHFAFLNLMRQGYHPVEIARLGGHTSLQGQYHYQQHMEYWVDVEIVQMMQRFSFYQETDGTSGEQSDYIDDEFIREKVLKTTDQEVKIPVEIGYCTDPNMYCQVEKCYFCAHWGISQGEFLLKRKEIENELKQCENEVGRLIKTLNNLYKIALSESFEEDFSEWNQDFNKDLFLTKNQLDEKIHRIINFSTNLSNRNKGRS